MTCAKPSIGGWCYRIFISLQRREEKAERTPLIKSPPLGFESQRRAGGDEGEGGDIRLTLTPTLSRQGRGRKGMGDMKEAQRGKVLAVNVSEKKGTKKTDI